jgi:hypothetical protein
LIEVIPENRPTIDEIMNLDIMKLAHDSIPNENWSKNHVISHEMEDFNKFQKALKAANKYVSSKVDDNKIETRNSPTKLERQSNDSDNKSSFCNLI